MARTTIDKLILELSEATDAFLEAPSAGTARDSKLAQQALIAEMRFIASHHLPNLDLSAENEDWRDIDAGLAAMEVMFKFLEGKVQRTTDNGDLQ